MSGNETLNTILKLTSELIKNGEKVSDDQELLKAQKEMQLSYFINITNHNDKFTKLLESYTDFVSTTLNKKIKMKSCFFWLSYIVLIVVVLITIASLFVVIISAGRDNFEIQDYILPIVTAIVTFLTSFIVIPKIIAEYLFNSNEESVMKDIVNSIQEYDKNIKNDIGNKVNNQLQEVSYK